MMHLKLGVTLTMTPSNERLLQAAEKAFAAIMGLHFNMVVTSGNDGVHMIGSLHYKDKAVDLRTGHAWDPPLMTLAQVQSVVALIKADLGHDYDVVIEEDHVHLEHDPKPTQPVPVHV